MGVELAGGEAFTACAEVGAALTTAVVGAATAAALSSDVGVELAEGEASSPSLTVARGQPESGYASSRPRPPCASCHAHASARLPVFVQAGVKVEASSGKVSFSIPSHASYSTRAQTPLSTHS